jgi:hypothetical protein
MAPKKSKQTKGEQLKAAQETKLEREAIAESDAALDNLQSSFTESKANMTQLEQQLADQVQMYRSSKQSQYITLCTEILSLKSKNNDIYHQLRMERQCHKRATSKHGSITSQILLVKKADAIQ